MSELANRKYRIEELLRKLPFDQHSKALKVLPVQVGISPPSLSIYRKIKLDDPQDIPHTVVAKMEQFFGIGPGELQNFTTTVTPISRMMAVPDDDPGSFGLNKR